MRSNTPTPPSAEPQRGAATIRMADYHTRPATQASWNELAIRREEIRLPVAPTPPTPR